MNESMASLKEFQELINEIDDTKLLSVAEDLLTDIVDIENMKERIEMLEDGLCKGDRVAFWFTAINLDRECVDLATNTVKGRRRVVMDKESAIKAERDLIEAEEAEAAEIAAAEADTEEVEVSGPSSFFEI